MKRRNFLKNLGLGTAGLSVANKSFANDENQLALTYQYGTVESFEDAITKDGEIIIRIEFLQTENDFHTIKESISVNNAILRQIRSFHFEKDEDILNPEEHSYQLHITPESSDILVLWLQNTNSGTQIFLDSKKKTGFTIQEIIDSKDLILQLENVKISVNLLLDKEIGEIQPEDVGINQSDDNFTFIAMADPQGGDAQDHNGNLRTRMKVHNAFIEESVDLVNRLKIDPLFTIVIGDITDDWGFEKDFMQMNKFLRKLKTPVLYEIGNHETLLHSKFSPGYNMDAFNNYFAAQMDISGIDKLLYSFNLGKWHFIVWPDPLRENFWKHHPHYFDWLEKDLAKHKDRPTMVFQHVPIHPIGINPLVHYAESVTVKRLVLDILSKYGNVKYVLSGHVHIPVKSSVKTAVTINNIKFINLPAAGFRPRAFGESDYYGGPSQGIAIVNIEGESAEITYKTVVEDEFRYPDKLPEFDHTMHALWFNYKYELPAADKFINPDFNDGLKGWVKQYVYEEDFHKSNICEVRKTEQLNALYLYSKRRGYMAPGQDRLPQDINSISQAVRVINDQSPVIHFSYKLDGENCDFKGYSGAYICIEGYHTSVKKLDILLSANKTWANIGRVDWNNNQYKRINLDLDQGVDKWYFASVNLKEILEKIQPERKFKKLGIDRIIITFGIWNVNDGDEQPFAYFFKDVNLSNAQIDSNINGNSIKIKDNENDVWWRGKYLKNANIAGEHRYWSETQKEYKIKND